MGKKIPVIVLHGWGSNPNRWKTIYEDLSHFKKMFGVEYQVFTPCLPGFDIKNPLEKPYTVMDYGEWLDDYIRIKQIKNPVIIGHSNGGRIAMYYCAHFKNSISKLILIDAAGIPPKNTVKKTVFKLLASMGKILLEIIPNKKIYAFCQKMLYKLARESDYVKASPIMKKTMQNMLAYDATPDLSKISVPTLCVWGKNDKATPIWMGKQISRQISSAQLVTLESGHNPHTTHAKELAKVITDFIQ